MENTEIKTNLKSLTIIFFALIAGQMMFLGVILYLHFIANFLPLLDIATSQIFGYLVPLIVITAIPGGYFIYNQRAKNSANLVTVTEKLQAYRSTKIIQYVIFESASLFSLIALLLSWQMQFIYMFLIVIVIFLLNMPSENKFRTDFNVQDL